MKKLLLVVALLPLTIYALEAPIVTITCEVVDDSIEVTLNWNEIVGANQYCIFTCGQEPYSDGSLIECVSASPYVFRTQDWQFFYIVAESSPEPPLGFIYVPAGTFMMGQQYTATPIHEVTLLHDFYLGTNEVTNEEYVEALQWAYDQGLVTASSNTVEAYGEELVDLDSQDAEIEFESGIFSVSPSNAQYYAQGCWTDFYWGAGEVYGGYYEASVHPVQSVTWFGAACYCDWKSGMEGITPFYQGDWSVSELHNPYTASSYRLPTEAEWEYAARFDDGRSYPWGEDYPYCTYANTGTWDWENCYEDWWESLVQFCVGWTWPVGQHPIGNSELGLTDLAGNVSEWVNDWYEPYTSDSQNDPLGPTTGTSRCVRGGGWLGGTWSNTYVKSAQRGYSSPDSENNQRGFRTAISVER